MLVATRYSPTFVALSIVVAIFASYIALEFAGVLSKAAGRSRLMWLACGAFAMGIGIWSMHFVGMLAFDMGGMSMAYDIPLMLLSIIIAIVASWMALFVVSRQAVSVASLVVAGCAMAAAISGMHYTGMYSMRMAAVIHWNYFLVALSIFIALVASFAALLIALRMRSRVKGSFHQVLASIVMGFAISGMHYTGMAAASFEHTDHTLGSGSALLATNGLAIAVLIATTLVLGLALASSVVERAMAVKTKKAEESAELYLEAEKSLNALQREREIRERFMSALAHDLRTPLASANMSVQLGIRHSTNAELVELNCGRAVQSLRRMDQMIEDLLDAHRLSAGQALALNLEKCHLVSLLRAIVDDLTTVHGQRFQLKGDESVNAYLDLKALRRAVENLCNNAVKYGKPGASVEICADLKGKDLVRISVHNEGEPISEKDQNRLFDLFVRGEKVAGGPGGWGLGLNIVKGVAEAHGGTVRIESSTAKGTSFILEIPLRGVE